MEESKGKTIRITPALIAAGVLTAINAAIQTAGLFYQDMPSFWWHLADCIQIMAPLLFGIGAGLVCFLPCAITELFWFANLLSPGPLLHIISFAVVVAVLGLIHDRILDKPLVTRCVITAALYEISLILEEALYYILRIAVMHKDVLDWKTISASFMSWANPIILLCGLAFIVRESRRTADSKPVTRL